MSSSELEKFVEACTKEALGRLSYVGQYTELMGMLHNGDVSKNEIFRQQYGKFYKLRRPLAFRDEYFKYMEKNKGNASLTFKKILTDLRTFGDAVEASFASKLLHTIRPNFPTWDTWIGKYTKILIPRTDECEGEKDQFTLAVERYAKLNDWFDEYIHSQQGKTVLELFNRYYPVFNLTDTKKIDLVLWQWRHEGES